MIRFLLWCLAGVVLGLIVHLTAIIAFPYVTTNQTWASVEALEADEIVIVIEHPEVGAANPLGLDPEIAYAVCQFDLSRGPGVFTGVLPNDFWSLAIFNKNGVSIYSTTNRSGVGTSLELGIFNAAQTRLLAEQQFEIEEGLLIVESNDDDLFAIVRLAVPHPVMRSRYEADLKEMQCGHIDVLDVTS